MVWEGTEDKGEIRQNWWIKFSEEERGTRLSIGAGTHLPLRLKRGNQDGTCGSWELWCKCRELTLFWLQEAWGQRRRSEIASPSAFTEQSFGFHHRMLQGVTMSSPPHKFCIFIHFLLLPSPPLFPQFWPKAYSGGPRPSIIFTLLHLQFMTLYWILTPA